MKGLIMGLFDFGKKKEDTSVSSQNLTLSSKLQLRVKTFENVLKTNILASDKAQVVFVLDASGSMQGLYQNGEVQEIVERLMPVAIKFDDNQSMEVFLFSSYQHDEITPATVSTMDNYINTYAMRKAEFGGTKYAPVIEDIIQKYKNDKLPTFVIFITDGDNSDHSDTVRVMREASKYPIFFKFVGIGSNERFTFLEKLDDLSGRVIDNANFIQIKQISKETDENLYKSLMIEYPEWQMAATKANIL
jgi:uncharacterized protein with von Willebrand factor type A (vWA) domain